MYTTEICQISANGLLPLGSKLLHYITLLLRFPRPSTGPPSPDSPKLLWRLLRKLPGKLPGAGGSVGGSAAEIAGKSALALRSRETALLPAVSAAVPPALPPALVVSPAVSAAVSTAILGNPGLGALWMVGGIATYYFKLIFPIM